MLKHYIELPMVSLYLFFIVQIVLESFPVSSSGHIFLLKKFLQQISCNISFFSYDVFVHILHGPTVAVIACFFFKRWFFLVKNIKRCWPIICNIIFLLGIADTITFLFFLFFKKIGHTEFPLWCGFVITATVLYSLRWCRNRKPSRWVWWHACIIGAAQGCALIPGISRFALVFASARWLRLPKHKAFEITWLISVPLITVASIRGAYLSWSETVSALLMRLDLFFIVLLVSVIAYYALCFVYYLIQADRLWWFAWYMVVPFIISFFI